MPYIAPTALPRETNSPTVLPPAPRYVRVRPARKPKPSHHVRHSPKMIHPLEPRRVHFNAGWLIAGALGALGGLIGLKRFGWPLAAGGALAGLLTYGHARFGEPGRPTLERVTLRLPNLPEGLDGMRIGQLSDIHLGFPFTARNLAWGVTQMERERPDVIVLTGDFAFPERIVDLVRPLRRLQAPLGVYAVPGNHDYDPQEELMDLKGVLDVLGIPLILNTNRRIVRQGTSFWLLGIDDLWDGHAYLHQALQGVPRDAFTMLLAHAPDVADEAAACGINLQLSGHTHGGHMRAPLLGPAARPRFGQRYVMGHYQVGAMQLYVSRGLGGKPLRLLCPPEVTMLTLRRA